jgi:hypothetical protein
MEPPSKPVTTPLVVQKFQQTSSNIAGTSTNLAQSLKELEAGDVARRNIVQGRETKRGHHHHHGVIIREACSPALGCRCLGYIPVPKGDT